MSREFYKNLNDFFVKEENSEQNEDEYSEYKVDMNDSELEEEYIKILPDLDLYNENLDLSQYIK